MSPHVFPPRLRGAGGFFSAHRRVCTLQRSCTCHIGSESVPIQLAQCRFPEPAVSNAKISIYFSNKIYGSNFIKQHSETVMVWNCQNADYGLRKKTYCAIYIIFGTLSCPTAWNGNSWPPVELLKLVKFITVWHYSPRAHSPRDWRTVTTHFSFF